MGARTTSTTSGGGAATPVANDFQAWLSSQMNGTPYQSTQASPSSAINIAQANGTGGQLSPEERARISAQTGIQFQPPGGAAGGTPNPTNPGQMSAGSPFQNAFNSMLSGQVIDPSGANAAIASGIGSGASQFGQNYQNPYASQNYNAAQTSQLPTNQLQGSGMADLSSVNPTALSNYNVQPGSSQYTSMLNGLLGQGQQMAGQNNVPQASAGAANIGPGISLDPATQFDMNNPYFNALKTQQERALQQATADNNARFGAQGAGAIGSGAQLANSNLQSAASADQTVALQQALQGLQQQDLAERGTRANVGLGSRGQDAQVGIANMQAQLQASLGNQSAGLQGNQQNNQLLSTLLGAAGGARGQDFQNSQFAQGLGMDQSQFNAGQINNRNGQDLSALLANQGLGNNFQTGAAELNNNAMQTNNLNSINQANSLNGFNLTNAGNTAQYGQANNALNSQNYQQNQNNFLNMLGLGQNVNNTANNNIQGALQQLFGGFGQSTGLGIEQRNTQVNQQGSPWGGILGSVLPIAGQAFSAWNNNRGNSNPSGSGFGTSGGGIGYGGSTMPTSNWG